MLKRVRSAFAASSRFGVYGDQGRAIVPLANFDVGVAEPLDHPGIRGQVGVTRSTVKQDLPVVKAAGMST